MRTRVALVALSLVFASASALQAQDAAATQAAPPAASAAAAAVPATPAETAAPASDPASTKNVVCEVSNDQGEVVPLRQCVSKDEANRRRFQQQEAIRQFQQQSMTMQPH